MRLTETHLSSIAGRAANDNMRSVLAGLARSGVGAGLNRPHRLAHYLAQLAHESGGFRWDREIWGPTDAQKRYEGRKDLGNTEPGDGSLYRGRGPIQLTGRNNYAQFTAWARRMTLGAPDFEAAPEAVNTDPWEGLVPIWYWDSRGLNDLADANDIRGVTKRINGGFNGLDDRMRYYTRAALVLLGYAPVDVARFQQGVGLVADNIAGPLTRAALHKSLSMAPLVSFVPPEPHISDVPLPPPKPLPLDPLTRELPEPVLQPWAILAFAVAAVAALAFFGDKL